MENYDGETTSVKDIDLLRFRLQRSQLPNSTANPDNAAYYSFGPSGMINVTNCMQKVPVWRRTRK